jgi:hypothetical protein
MFIILTPWSRVVPLPRHTFGPFSKKTRAMVKSQVPRRVRVFILKQAGVVNEVFVGLHEERIDDGSGVKAVSGSEIGEGYHLKGSRRPLTILKTLSAGADEAGIARNSRAI